MNAKTLNGIIKLTERAKKAEVERDELRAKLEGGVRVHANQYVDRDDRWLCSHYGNRKDIHNATLLIDDAAHGIKP